MARRIGQCRIALASAVVITGKVKMDALLTLHPQVIMGVSSMQIATQIILLSGAKPTWGTLHAALCG